MFRGIFEMVKGMSKLTRFLVGITLPIVVWLLQDYANNWLFMPIPMYLKMRAWIFVALLVLYILALAFWGLCTIVLKFVLHLLLSILSLIRRMVAFFLIAIFGKRRLDYFKSKIMSFIGKIVSFIRTSKKVIEWPFIKVFGEIEGASIAWGFVFAVFVIPFSFFLIMFLCLILLPMFLDPSLKKDDFFNIKTLALLSLGTSCLGFIYFVWEEFGWKPVVSFVGITLFILFLKFCYYATPDVPFIYQLLGILSGIAFVILIPFLLWSFISLLIILIKRLCGVKSKADESYNRGL